MSASNAFTFPSPHRHTKRCFWDLEEAAWVCPSEAGLGGSEPALNDQPLVDVRDMVVVHTALLREFRLAPTAVERVRPGDSRHSQAVDRHLGLLCDLLHHHHEGEERLLFAPLHDRLPSRAIGVLTQAEEQHGAIDNALEEVGNARARWQTELTPETSGRLADSLRALYALLAEHLDEEERNLLPLAAAHVDEREWKAVGQAGAEALPKPMMPLVFGMFAYEGDPEVVASMLKEAPPLARLVIGRIAPYVYARHASQIHGTRRP